MVVGVGIGLYITAGGQGHQGVLSRSQVTGCGRVIPVGRTEGRMKRAGNRLNQA